MRLILEVIAGPFQGKQIEAKVGETVRIGRTTKSDVAMEDDFMSSEHFAIECNFRSCRVRDLKSRNGTQLNGKLITEASLTDGDQVHAGRTDFKVRIEDLLKTVELSDAEEEDIKSESSEAESQRKPSVRLPPVPVTGPAPAAGVSPNPQAERSAPRARTTRKRVDQTSLELPPAPAPPPAADIPRRVIESYEAATPEGRLMQILSSQPGSLMALVDAVHNVKLLDLLRSSSETWHSLYRNDQSAAIAPYLVALPPRSELLKQMVEKGWGHEWGVYLNSPLSLGDMRQFFRTSLMVTMPDGVELFSRFYDPRFFRSFLETCSAAEAEKFFGPITSYFMEDERPEILLQFSRSKRGAEKKGHLLTRLG